MSGWDLRFHFHCVCRFLMSNQGKERETLSTRELIGKTNKMGRRMIVSFCAVEFLKIDGNFDEAGRIMCKYSKDWKMNDKK